MKTTYAYASIVLALMTPTNVLAQDSSSCGDCDGVCVTFDATDDSLYYWWNGGPGGDPTTFGGSQIGSTCLTGGGALFVGASDSVASGGGNTKFEWDVADSTSYFDVSVCDGFSVPMTCTGFEGNEGPYTTIGGGELCSGDCPSSDVDGANCVNSGSHTGVFKDVPSCFQQGMGAEGESGENNYWLFDGLSVQAIFSGRSGVSCTVGWTSSKEKRVEPEKSAAELGPRATKHRQHGHQKRAHGHHGLHMVS